MPHFVIAYSQDLEQDYSIETIMHQTHKAAVDSGLFSPERIKVRAKPYEYSIVGGVNKPFIHTTVYLLQGRSKEQRVELSKLVRTAIKETHPEVDNVTVDVRELDDEIYQR